jgi:hypothetical protein
MHINDLKHELLKAKKFSSVTIAYWCEWFEALDCVPTNVEQTLTWISDMEDETNERLSNCPFVSSWSDVDDETLPFYME